MQNYNEKEDYKSSTAERKPESKQVTKRVVSAILKVKCTKSHKNLCKVLEDS